jgi:hypothetical protein
VPCRERLIVGHRPQERQAFTAVHHVVVQRQAEDDDRAWFSGAKDCDRLSCVRCLCYGLARAFQKLAEPGASTRVIVDEEHWSL